jgi:hypothetical protein
MGKVALLFTSNYGIEKEKGNQAVVLVLRSRL